MNRPYHDTKFVVWWDHLDGATGKVVRAERTFKRKDEAALFIRKQPAIAKYPDGSGCYKHEESKEVARDGKTRTTTVREDVWSYREIVEMTRG